MDIVERLKFDAARCEVALSKGIAGNISEAVAEIERLRAALTLIAAFKNKTLIAPSFGQDYDRAHQIGSNAAFNQMGEIAASALDAS